MDAAKKQHERWLAEKRRERKRAVRRALESGGTVPFGLSTLPEDGWSAATIRRVYRATEAA